jgi:hypothetical protein
MKGDKYRVWFDDDTYVDQFAYNMREAVISAANSKLFNGESSTVVKACKKGEQAVRASLELVITRDRV